MKILEYQGKQNTIYQIGFTNGGIIENAMILIVISHIGIKQHHYITDLKEGLQMIAEFEHLNYTDLLIQLKTGGIFKINTKDRIPSVLINNLTKGV